MEVGDPIWWLAAQQGEREFRGEGGMYGCVCGGDFRDS